MSTPIRKIRAHAQTIPRTAPKPTTILVTICHNATVSVEAVMRRIMTNGISGGVKLVIVATSPLGCSESIGHSARGIIRMIIIGPMSDWASRNSVTALPTAAMIDAIIKYAIVKYAMRYIR